MLITARPVALRYYAETADGTTLAEEVITLLLLVSWDPCVTLGRLVKSFFKSKNQFKVTETNFCWWWCGNMT